MTQQLLNKIISSRANNSDRLNKLKREFARGDKAGMATNAALLKLAKRYQPALSQSTNQRINSLLIKRKIRTLSGVAPIAVLTKPFPCPGKCAYCPTEKEMPKSYLSNEPAVMRAVMTKFDPFVQVKTRLNALANNGHDTDKIELIIMGGTWSCLPKSYQTNFVKRCFDACNESTKSEILAVAKPHYGGARRNPPASTRSNRGENKSEIRNSKSKNLEEAQKINETANHRIVAMTMETRPDYVNGKEIKRWRELGATKVELGVQIIDDKILKSNKRGSTVDDIVRATKLFRQAGFKICYHIMPNLPGATPAVDLNNYKKLFNDSRFQPDFIKIYPTVVTKNSELYKWWRLGKYKPYSSKQLFKLLTEMKLATPEYVRIIRLIRDIPEESIVAGNKISNLRQSLQAELKKQGRQCRCIRCREAREDISGINKAKLFIGKYRASDADEYFLQFTSPDRAKLFAFLRLRLPNKDEQNFIKEIDGCAMIREVHTYGKMAPLKRTKNKTIQHGGLGTRLTGEAERIARQNGFKKISVIAGVGVRGFYKKLGYEPAGTYLVKNL
ncbi:MAG: tRNA uridine(34) 5-carboxymethylaminomethyl modification radical SAM/GNAT enzyme Elp3 [Parcubacteria group bacterium]